MNKEFAGVLAAGLAIFGLIFVANNVDGLDFGVGEQPEEMVLMKESPGQVGDSNRDFRTIDFGDFTVGEARGEITAYERERVELSDSLFSGNSVWFQYNATQPRGGEVTFEVLGREGTGSVYVEVNGEKVYSEPLIASSTPEITIPDGSFRPGMNDVEIGVNRDEFFSSSTYAIEELDVVVNDRKFHDFQEDFQLYEYEMADYVESPLTFRITDSVKTSPLKIWVNDNQIYDREQVRVEETVKITPSNADLSPGSNSIKFGTEGEAMYELSNTGMTVRYVGTTEIQDIETDFSLNSSQLNYAEREDTAEYLVFDYQNLLPSPRPMEIVLNSDSRTLNPSNGRNRISIDEENLEGENELMIRSNGTYQMNSLRMVSREVEE